MPIWRYPVMSRVQGVRTRYVVSAIGGGYIYSEGVWTLLALYPPFTREIKAIRTPSLYPSLYPSKERLAL